MKPGKTYLPVASITSAPRGAVGPRSIRVIGTFSQKISARYRSPAVTISPFRTRRLIYSLGRFPNISDPFAEPTGANDLLPGVELNPFLPLDMEISVERVIPAGEWEHCHGRGDANVDPDHSRFCPMLELPRGLPGIGENGRAIAISGAVRDLNRMLKIIRPDDIQDRAENLFAGESHLVPHLVNNGRAEKESVRRIAHPRVASV